MKTVILIFGLVAIAATAAEETTTVEPEIEATTSLVEVTESPVLISEDEESGSESLTKENVTIGGAVDNEVFPVVPTTEREAIIARLCGDVKDFQLPHFIEKNYPYYLSGFDYEDRPIWIVELGKYDLKRIVEAGPESIANFDKFVKLTTCRMMSSHKLRNEYGHDIVFILDFEGLQISQLASLPTMSYLLTLARDYRKVIEDYTHYIFIMNANYVTEALANLVRPIFGKILEITDIHGTNRQKWLPELLKRFPKDQIPDWYGGEKGYKPIQIYG